MNYDFSTLNDKDLEELALDLLNAEFNLGLQSFKVGQDGGIDLRYSTPENNNEIVVQVKHYLKSGENKLIKAFKEIELPKVKKLKPKRYIIVTSIGLSATQKDDLKDTFNPFIQSSNDILGKEDLNALLRGHKEVEKKHFKLWFSSSEVLSSILNNAIEGRSRNYLQQIRNKIPLYVLNSNFDNANKILEKEKLLVITGMPGIGKTTLADVLLLEKARLGYKIYNINNIRDAEDVISADSEDKQVFYFDDFLGDVYYQLSTGSERESEIYKFINRIVTESNKYLILSTRTVILEQAKNKSEKIKRSALDVVKYEIELIQYSKFEKAKILYNHMYFRGLNIDYINILIKDKFYNNIINHRNYTPRLIEYFTDNRRIHHVKLDSFREFVIYNLNHPEEIWRSAIDNQIDYLERCFLYTLFTFRISPNVSDVRRSYDKRLTYEIEVNNQKIKTNQFEDSIKNLMNGFIYINMTNVDFRFEKIRFINPSIADFLMGELRSNEKEKEAILNSIVFIEQLEIFNHVNTGLKLFQKQQLILLKKISSNIFESIYSWNKPIDVLYLNSLVKYCFEIDYDDLFVEILDRLDRSESLYNKNEFLYVLQNVQNAPKSVNKIKELFYELIDWLIEGMNDSNLASFIPDLFNQYDFDFETYLNTENGNEKMTELIFNVVEKAEMEIYDSKKGTIRYKEELVELVYEELETIKSSIIGRLNPGLIVDIPSQLLNEEVEEQIKINHNSEVESEKRIQNLSNYSEVNFQNELDKIDDLFYFEQFDNKSDELPY
jgi:hypothetical protein